MTGFDIAVAVVVTLSALIGLWRGVIRHDIESGDAWLLLEFELWLHAARDPELGVVGREPAEPAGRNDRGGDSVRVNHPGDELEFLGEGDDGDRLAARQEHRGRGVSQVGVDAGSHIGGGGSGRTRSPLPVQGLR